MATGKHLIDSNAVVNYLGKKLPPNGMDFMNQVIDNEPNGSVITKIEDLGFNAPDEHHQLLINFMNDVSIIDLTPDVVDKSIAVRKNYKIKLPDAGSKSVYTI